MPDAAVSLRVLLLFSLAILSLVLLNSIALDLADVVVPGSVAYRVIYNLIANPVLRLGEARCWFWRDKISFGLVYFGLKMVSRNWLHSKLLTSHAAKSYSLTVSSCTVVRVIVVFSCFFCYFCYYCY